jgi:hypothetical protein
MITKEQILAATGEELSRLAGEVLRGTHDNMGGRCKKCLLCREYQKPPFGCHVDITWPEAMKCRDWAVKEFGDETFSYTFVDVWVGTSHNEMGPDFVSYALPEHYIKAACICKMAK